MHLGFLAKMIGAIHDYWGSKGFLERLFWAVFGTFIVAFLFYYFGFENLLIRYEAAAAAPKPQSLPQEIQKPVPSPIQTIQKISRFPKIHIREVQSHLPINMRASGEFEDLASWLGFVDRQSQILSFSFKQDEDLELGLTFLPSSPSETSIKALHLKNVFFSTQVLNLEMIINNQAKINSRYYRAGERIHGLKIKQILHNAVILEDSYQHLTTLGF